jgi:ribosomal protein L11 methyltransferase
VTPGGAREDTGRSGSDRAVWLVVPVWPAAGADPLLVVDALRREGARAVEREGFALVAHLPLTRPAADTLRSVEAALRSVGGGSIGTAVEEDGAEWSRRWQRSEPTTVEVGDRLVVVTGETDPPGDRLPIRIRPGLAFGAADHPTTRACLRLLEEVVRPGHRIVDVGAGSGVLAIGAIRLGAADAVAIEADPLACAEARANVEWNALDARVRVVRRRVGRGDLVRYAPLDGVVANVEFSVLMPLLGEMHAAIGADGWVVLAGVVADEQMRLVRAASGSRLALVGEAAEEGWWAGAFRRAA